VQVLKGRALGERQETHLALNGLVGQQRSSHTLDNDNATQTRREKLHGKGHLKRFREMFGDFCCCLLLSIGILSHFLL
jgi:hypothetical protein